MKHFLLMTILLVSLTSQQSFAQVKAKKKNTGTSEVLTNATVIDLTKAGLDKDLIISKINTSETSFDLSTPGLIALKTQKVDNDIIKVMMNKANGIKGEPVAATVSKPPSKKTLPALDLINQVYRYNKPANTAVPLEKTVATMKTKTKFLGYGGASVLYIIEGDKSPVRMAATDSAYFLINVGMSLPDMTLYKLTINKNARQATTQNINSGFKGFSGTAMTGGATIPFNVLRVSDGVYEIIPSKTLEKGEYFFATKPVASASSVDVYAFGVD